MTSQNICIVGGGIGGLTAALSAAKEGHTVTLLEQARAFTEAGAGIQLSPNASRVLHHLGLEAPLRGVGFLPQGTQFRHWRSARVISESTLGETALERYGAPYYHIHRGDLLRVLVDAAQSSPNISLHTGARVDSFQQNENIVEVTTSNQRFESDVLVGADGIHSTTRAQLWGTQAPTFTGNIAWRALVQTDRLPPNLIRPMSTAWWGPGKHFVHYYVRGGEYVNCVCVVEKDGWEVESWTESGDINELRSDFSGWHDDIQTLIANINPDSLFKWALFDRPPMKRWGKGRVTLLGDACHPTLPFMAQGAAMAIEDAAVLAACLSAQGDVADELARYEELRRARTKGVQTGSRRNAKMFHLSGWKAWMRNRAVRTAGNRAMESLYRYNALHAVSHQDPP